MQTKGWETDRSSPQVGENTFQGGLPELQAETGCPGGEWLVRSRRFGSKTWDSELGSGKEGMRGWQSWSGKLRD